MKVHCQYEPNQSGKGKFLGRLIPALKRIGVTVVFDPKGADLTLSFTRFRQKTSDMPKVLRIDGVHLVDTKRTDWSNKRIMKSVKKADAVIWQSQISKDFGRGILGVAPKDYIIFNGADPKEFDVEPVSSGYPNNVILSAKWSARDDRRLKRLKPMHEIALEYVKSHEDTCFWIAGKTDGKEAEWEQHERVKWLGLLDSATLATYLKMADVVLHLARYDWMPNSVVEAVCAGCYPICNNGGGHGECAKACNGTVLEIDEPLKVGKIASCKPPPFDHKIVIEALERVLRDRPPVDSSCLHIDQIAIQYKKVFKDVCRKS